MINIGSVLGPVTFALFGIYGASKLAAEMLTDCERLPPAMHSLAVGQPACFSGVAV